MSTLLKEAQDNKQTENFSPEYNAIRMDAEKNWPEWVKAYYNESFATSSHANKFETNNSNK